MKTAQLVVTGKKTFKYWTGLCRNMATRIAHKGTQALGPLPAISGFAVDICRSRKQLLAENALLRQQLIVVARQIKTPNLRTIDRVVMLTAASWTTTWRQATLLVKPETILRWHRSGFKLFWRRKARRGKRRARVPGETIELIVLADETEPID